MTLICVDPGEYIKARAPDILSAMFGPSIGIGAISNGTAYMVHIEHDNTEQLTPLLDDLRRDAQVNPFRPDIYIGGGCLEFDPIDPHCREKNIETLRLREAIIAKIGLALFFPNIRETRFGKGNASIELFLYPTTCSYRFKEVPNDEFLLFPELGFFR